MTTKYVEYCTRFKLPCSDASSRDVILCLQDSALLEPTDCPGDEGTFVGAYASATICGYYGSGEGCGPSRYVYTFSYDDAILADVDTPLVAADIIGAFCKDCLFNYFANQIGSEVYIRDEDDDTQTLISQHGCEYPIIIPDSQQLMLVTDTNSMNLTINGTIPQTLSADAKISADALNRISIHADGLYSSQSPMLVTDTTSIDLTIGGTVPQTLTAAAKISADADNALSIHADGLYAEAGGGGGSIGYNQDTNTGGYSVTDTFANVGLSILLPEAGTYQISSTILWVGSFGTEGGTDSALELQLYDATAAAVVPGSTDNITFATVVFNLARNVYSKTIQYTVTEASTIQVQARQPSYSDASNTSITLSYDDGDSPIFAGTSVLNYIQLTGSGGGGGGGNPILVADTDSIDLSIFGDPQLLSADAKISADAGNGIEIRADGLYASSSSSIVYDSAMLDSDYTITGLVANTGLSLALPAAGTYLVTTVVNYSLNTSTTNWNVTLYLDNSSSGQIGIADIFSSLSSGTIANYMTSSDVITVFAATTLHLQAAGSGFGSAKIEGGSERNSKMNYIKLA